MRLIILLIAITAASQVSAKCGNLCDITWWETATKENLETELKSGSDIMARSENGNTPMHLSAQSSTAENIAILLAAGADVMVRTDVGSTPLHRAAQNSSHDVIQVLLDAGANVMARS